MFGIFNYIFICALSEISGTLRSTSIIDILVMVNYLELKN